MPKIDGELTDDELEQVVGGSKDMKILLESWRRWLQGYFYGWRTRLWKINCN